MRTWRRVAVGLALAGWAGAQEMSADEKAIRELPGRYAEAWNKGDAKVIAGLFAPDGDLVGAAGEAMKGQAEVEQGTAAQLAGMYKGSTDTNTTTSVRFLTPEIALADGTWEFSGVTGPDGKPMSMNGLWTAVLLKKDGSWWIGALRAMRPIPMPASAPN
jgi:uncharacterized protein (TIGR02246 family)